MEQAETISAVATAIGEGGIGIIRISGKTAIAVVDKLFKAVNGKKIADTATHKAVYGRVIDEAGEIVDEAICLLMRSPNSYTKEDVVELQCHGGVMPLRKTLALTYKAGARPAEPGEFTKRAFLNGRLDLSQAQAVMDVINARTEASLHMATGHLQGKFSGKIHTLRHSILEMIAHLEAAIDFPEDEVDDVVIDEVREKVTVRREEIAKILRTARTGRILREGLTTAIVGKPNVGKSSLLNALLQEERAIVTDIPGTTRDSIEEYANIGGVPLRIIDTAGIRETDDIVEKMGVDKAREYVENASLVLALFDGSRELTAEDKEIIDLIKDKDALVIINKTDLLTVTDKNALKKYLPANELIEISTTEETGLHELAEAIKKRVYAGEVPSEEGSFISNERQAMLMEKADEHLKAAITTIDNGMSADFIVIDLRSAWETLGEITGETVGEDIIDQIFSQFCIGK